MIKGVNDRIERILAKAKEVREQSEARLGKIQDSRLIKSAEARVEETGEDVKDH